MDNERIQKVHAIFSKTEETAEQKARKSVYNHAGETGHQQLVAGCL